MSDTSTGNGKVVVNRAMSLDGGRERITYAGGTFGYATALAISPDGHTLYVTGHCESDTIDIATIAYRA